MHQKTQPEAWGLLAGTVLTALVGPVWLLVSVLWLGSGYEDHYWDSRCHRGEPRFAVGQAALAIAGTLAASCASVGTVRTFRSATSPSTSLRLGFCAAAACLLAWGVVVANAPAARRCEHPSLLSPARTQIDLPRGKDRASQVANRSPSARA